MEKGGEIEGCLTYLRLTNLESVKMMKFFEQMFFSFYEVWEQKESVFEMLNFGEMKYENLERAAFCVLKVKKNYQMCNALI